MGQQAEAFAIWPGQNKPIFPDFEKLWNSTITGQRPSATN